MFYMISEEELIDIIIGHKMVKELPKYNLHSCKKYGNKPIQIWEVEKVRPQNYPTKAEAPTAWNRRDKENG